MLSALFMAAQLLVACLGGLLAAGLWITLGGLGALSHLNKRAEVLEDQVTRLDSRLSRDQKTRSAEKGVEARQETRSIKEQAMDHLKRANGPVASVRLPGRTQARK